MPGRTSALVSLLLVGCTTAFCSPTEIIYDNTNTILGAGPRESAEYGDQLDLEGTARTLTALTVFYYGQFDPDAHQTMKVRLYTNEKPWDNFRKQPTTLLYESGNMPMLPGYNARTLDNLNVKLPFDTVTCTIQFSGLKTNEFGSLVLCNPPTIGSSFNEFWRRTPNGWDVIQYSPTDFSLKANAGIKLIARAESAVASQQSDATDSVSVSLATNTPPTSQGLTQLVAQTFSPILSGRLDHIDLTFPSIEPPVDLVILDTATNGAPGTNVLGWLQITNRSPGLVTVPAYANDIFLVAGTNYALAISRAPGTTNLTTLAYTTNSSYTSGRLWFRHADHWDPAIISEVLAELGTTNRVTNLIATNLSAAFSLSIVPSAPAVRIASPPSGELIPYGATVPFRAELNLPSISTLYRVRFLDNDQELDSLFNPPHRTPPYEITWTATNSGPHILKLRVDDTFGRPFRSEQHIVTVSPAPPPTNNHTLNVAQTTNGAPAITFSTLKNERIQVQYSEDLTHWKTNTPDVFGTGANVTFVDNGPPGTDSAPANTRQRYYRVLFNLPQPPR